MDLPWSFLGKVPQEKSSRQEGSCHRQVRQIPVLLFDGIPHKIPAAIPAELYDFTLRRKQEKSAAVPFVQETTRNVRQTAKSAAPAHRRSAAGRKNGVGPDERIRAGRQPNPPRVDWPELSAP